MSGSRRAAPPIRIFLFTYHHDLLGIILVESVSIRRGGGASCPPPHFLKDQQKVRHFSHFYSGTAVDHAEYNNDAPDNLNRVLCCLLQMIMKIACMYIYI